MRRLQWCICSAVILGVGSVAFLGCQNDGSGPPPNSIYPPSTGGQATDPNGSRAGLNGYGQPPGTRDPGTTPPGGPNTAK